LLANPAAETLIRDICGDNNFQDFQEPDFFEKSGLLECINDSLKTEKLKTCQLHLTKHNSEGIYLDVHCLPFYTKNEKKVLIMVGDVTEQKEMEEKILEAQKLDSIGTLTGGIAHDFNNTLT
jgi:nitrogen-specific signal transduction histidine kinase